VCLRLISRSDCCGQFFQDAGADFTVIGVIGTQASGKTTIASVIADQRASLTASMNDGRGTEGIDVLITSDRLIVLDTQVDHSAVLCAPQTNSN